MKLLDHIKETQGIKNDRQLAVTLKFGQPVISRLRTGKQKISAEVILRIHETFNIPVKEIREMAGENA